MINVTPGHLASIMLQAKRETALHTRNVGVYGNSSEPDDVEGWVQVRDYLKEETVKTWRYDQRRPSQHKRIMAEAERLVEVYNENILAVRILALVEADLYIRHERQVAAA